MLAKQIELRYTSGNHEQFDIDYDGTEFIFESSEVKIIMNRQRFEEIRDKINKLDKEVN